MATVISHFYNEEFLLPFWLRHHKRLFCDGIMIDYASTDNSIDIIKKICPKWKIIKSKNKLFEAISCDKEIMEYESVISGWKMVLNITEFLLIDDIDYYCNSKDQFDGIKFQGVIMVESEDERKYDINPDKDLFAQRSYGYLEKKENGCYLGNGVPSRNRIIHKLKTGQYLPGRHQTYMKNLYFNPNNFILWFGLCPLDISIKRRIQIDWKMPHPIGVFIQNEESCMENYIKHLQKSYPLKQELSYKEALNAVVNKYSIKTI